MKKPIYTMIRPCTWVWLVLMGLTLLTLAIGQAELSGLTVVALLLVSVFIKTHLVADYFMGLHRSRLLWRMVVTIYLLVIISMIALAYWLGLS